MESPEPRVWLGGRIFTGRRWAEALAVSDGRVAAVGSDAQVRAAAPQGAARTELRGQLVVPGLIDAHLHWLGSVVDAQGVDLRGAGSIAELQRRLASAAARQPTGPLLGSGWDQEQLADHRYPTRGDLDAVDDGRPIALSRICHHAAVVNSAALEAMGIGPSTPDPPGGRIGRDGSGAPDGMLFDRAALGIRPLSLRAFEARKSEAAAFLARLAGRGLTTIDAMSSVAGEFQWARELHEQGSLPVRMRFHLLAGEWDGRPPPPDPSSSAPQVVGLKIVLDGSLGARTAWLEAPYHDAPDEVGLPLVAREEATSQIERASRAGLGVALHAIGDRAVREAADLLEAAPPTLGHRRIEHASVLSRSLVDRLGSFGPILVVQPRFVSSDVWLADRLGGARAAWAYPFRALIERGLTVAGSSDAPVESFDPWAGMAVAVGSCGLSATQALGMYTTSGAAALGEPGLGSLEAGAPADLVVLDAYGLEAAIATGGPVLSTWSSGRRVAEGALQRRPGPA